jgi:CRISPR-associated protein Cmr5
MSGPTLAQRRAAHALKRVRAREGDGIEKYGNYVSYAESFPSQILMNGLGQACASLLSKAKGKLEEPHGMLYDDLRSWLCGEDPAVPFKGRGDLMEALVKSEQKTYLHAQIETLAFLVWLKKFANAYLERGKDQE